MQKNQTICAVATPFGVGAIGIIRMSGTEALDIALKFFYKKNLNKNMVVPNTAYVGDFVSDGIKDRCIMIFFKAPHSYTGEDVVEFQVHGGTYLIEKILGCCVKEGALPACRGEFSKLAFLNGKISLDSAEGIIDTITAESESELLVAQRLKNGFLKMKIDALQNKIKNVISAIEVALDYPEHDEESDVISMVSDINSLAFEETEKLLKTVNAGEKIRKGIQVAIIGKPNVGKSSLLNSLIGENRAIVTAVAGTTRDLITETISYKGIKISFIDTAGIRNSDEQIEKIGIKLSREAAANADVVICVFDSSDEFSETDEEILKLSENKKRIIVLNKSDLKSRINKKFADSIVVSAAENKNTEKIKDRILEIIKNDNVDLTGDVIINKRHEMILTNALKICSDINKLLNNVKLDIIAFKMKTLWNILGEITGLTENEILIDAIFENFCLGK